MDNAEQQLRFMRRLDHAEIAASGKTEIDVATLRAQFGDDFNTLIITNTDVASAIELYLDGIKVAYITGNNGTFSFDWEFGIIYNFISLLNTNGGAVILANAIKITAGRSGKAVGA